MTKWKHISEARDEARARIKRRLRGEEKSLKTPWQKYDGLHLGGIEWGMLNLFAAMSGGGKTMFMGQMYRELHALNPDQEFIILLFNFEMAGQRLVIRDAIAKTKLKKNTLLSVDGYKMDEQDMQVLGDFFVDPIFDQKIFLVEKPCTPEEFMAIKKEMYEMYGLPVLTFSDHSLLFRGAKSDAERTILVELGQACIEQKNDIQDGRLWNTDFIFTQLNREIEKESRRQPCSVLNIPDKSCVFGSDALWQASDTVLISHRPYNLGFTGNTYSQDKLPTGPTDLYWHFLKLRDHHFPIHAKMYADFGNMRVLDGDMF